VGFFFGSEEEFDNMAVAESFLNELEYEAKITRRVLERVPEDKLSWKPHAKSMSLGQLALHLALSPGYAHWASVDVYEFTPDMATVPEAKSNAEILDAHDQSVAKAKQTLRQLGDHGLSGDWKGVAGGSTLMELPKVALMRTVVLNHTYHHRGQLSVYLRLLDVPVPSIYGPSADENRFGQPN
jgi:uncharacterized damage-inducible protein DinB